MKIKIVATAQQLINQCVDEKEANRLAGAVVDGIGGNNEWVVIGTINNGATVVNWYLSPEYATEITDAPALDLTKPVQTRDGRKVEIKFTTNYRICGILNGDILQWMLDGKSCQGSSAWDLVQAPEPLVEGWVNIYQDEENLTYAFKPSRKKADADAGSLKRVACIPVSFAKGQGL